MMRIFISIAESTDENNASGSANGIIQKYSYHATIEQFETRKRILFCCSGAVISKRIVITTAHCLFQIDQFRLRVHIGESEVENDGGKRYRVKDVKWHFKYLYGLQENNIGFVRAARPFDLNFAQPIGLFRPSSNEKFIINKTAVVTGWGIINNEYNHKLRAVSIFTSRNNTCESASINSSKEIICYGNEFENAEGSDNCFSDTGGLVAVDGLLVGFVYYANCDLDLIPYGVYYELHYFYDWILEMTSNLL